jgi:hypothetical protein
MQICTIKYEQISCRRWQSERQAGLSPSKNVAGQINLGTRARNLSPLYILTRWRVSRQFFFSCENI